MGRRDSLAELASDVAVEKVQQGRHQVEEEHPYPETEHAQQSIDASGSIQQWIAV